MGDLVYEPPRDGPTLWEIGIPDRSAAEFYIPDPSYINKLYVNHPDRLATYVFVRFGIEHIHLIIRHAVGMHYQVYIPLGCVNPRAYSYRVDNLSLGVFLLVHASENLHMY